MPRLYNLTPLLIIRVSDPLPERFMPSCGQIEWIGEMGKMGEMGEMGEMGKLGKLGEMGKMRKMGKMGKI